MNDIESLKKRITELENLVKETTDIFNAMGDFIFVIDNDSTITRVNDACAAFLKTKPQNVIGKKCYEIMHGTNIPVPNCPMEMTKHDIKPHVEEVNDPHIGVPLMVTTSPIFDRDHRMVGVVHVAKDISYIKKAERALKDNEIKYRTIFESSADAIMILKPHDGFLAGNLATVRLFGCKDEKEFLSKSPSDLSPEYQPDGQLSSAKSIKMMDIAMDRGSNFFEWRHRRVNGEEFLATVLLTRLELEGHKLLQATVRDITDNRKVADALRKEQEEERTILDSVPAWIFYKDKENRFLRVNKAFADIMQMSEKELEGKSIFDLYPKDQAMNYWADDKEVISSGKPKTNIVEFVDTKKGRLWVRTDKVPYKNEAGEIIGIIGFSVDITERKLAEEAIGKKMRDLEIFYKAAIDREIKIKELKKKIQELESRIK